MDDIDNKRMLEKTMRNIYLCDEWVRLYLSNMKQERRKLRSKSSGSSGRGNKSEHMDFDFK